MAHPHIHPEAGEEALRRLEGQCLGVLDHPTDVIGQAAVGVGDGVAAEKDTPIFVYCRSGARSAQAVKALAQMGYINVKNIGGIAAYTGKVER